MKNNNERDRAAHKGLWRRVRAPARRQHARPPALQWRGPWWAWQFLSWALATLTAPTFMLVCGLLLVNPLSDHPFFWGCLPGIIALGNAVAINVTNQRHHRKPYTGTFQLAWHYAGAGAATAFGLFLFTGWASGFLADVAVSIAGNAGTQPPVMATLGWSVLLAAGFGLLSFFHAGAMHAALGFHTPALPCLHAERAA